MEVLTHIHDQCYQDIIAIREQDVDIQGWMPDVFKEFFSLAINDVLRTAGSKDILIYEVGTWKGLFANTMANICKNMNITNFKIVCIDTWLGSPEHMESMSRVNGIPKLFSTFINNTFYFKNSEVIYPFPISSGSFLIDKSLLADIIYIDAGHEYEAVLLDIQLYWKLLKNGGFMIFDDYHSAWPQE